MSDSLLLNSIRVLPSHLHNVFVISTNSFWEFSIPRDKVYFLFLGERTLLPEVLS